MEAAVGVPPQGEESPRMKERAFIRGMSFRESRPPVGPLQHDSHRWGVQAPFCCPRWRTCLLEGCGRRFRPCCGRRHYCSEACREAARRWSEWKAQQEYRSSEKGRECRREQSRRWRERRREQGQPLKNPSASQASGACVGHQQEAGEKILATGRAATRVLTPRRDLLGSGSVLPCAARLYVARGRGKSVGGRAAAAAPWRARRTICRRGGNRPPTCTILKWLRKGVF